ncbi:MAG: HAMP domain-containing histidine kinase [Alteromonadaceae bacterium]|nr:HAMP domain-containing histidine kinase [Alteromonadaceae bacterium]
MFKGIRGQLFFGFGALVIVINLFYSRLTYLFVEVTEDLVAGYVMDLESTRLQKMGAGYTSIKDVITPPLSVEIRNSESEQLRQTSALYETLYIDYRDGVKHFSVPISHQGQAYWLSVASTEITPLTTASEVFSVFLGSISAGVIVLAMLATWFLASTLSLPLRRLTKSVSAHLPQAPIAIDEADRSDEIGELARTFEATYGDLQAAWRREHDFANDVSHELRTPVSIIKNVLSLSKGEEPLDNADRALLEQSTLTLQNTVEVLLALARRENLVHSAVPVVPIVERVLLSFYQSHQDEEFAISLNVADSLVVVGNPSLMALLFQNLVNNGFYHGGGQGMSIYQAQDQLVFENPVSDCLNENYQGLGHGQYLVSRIAGVMEWQLEIQSDSAVYRVMVSPKLAS